MIDVRAEGGLGSAVLRFFASFLVILFSLTSLLRAALMFFWRSLVWSGTLAATLSMAGRVFCLSLSVSMTTKPFPLPNGAALIFWRFLKVANPFLCAKVRLVFGLFFKLRRALHT